jgi:hypothetical protein
MAALATSEAPSATPPSTLPPPPRSRARAAARVWACTTVPNEGNGACFILSVAQALGCTEADVRQRMVEAVGLLDDADIALYAACVGDGHEDTGLAYPPQLLPVTREGLRAYMKLRVPSDAFVLHTIFPLAYPRAALLIFTDNNHVVRIAPRRTAPAEPEPEPTDADADAEQPRGTLCMRLSNEHYELCEFRHHITGATYRVVPPKAMGGLGLSKLAAIYRASAQG